MRYLKTYEQNSDEPKFKVGDYVRLWSRYTGKISQYKKDVYGDTFRPYNNYFVEFFAGDNYNTQWFSETNIKELATSNEIEEFELKLISNKYNI